MRGQFFIVSFLFQKELFPCSSDLLSLNVSKSFISGPDVLRTRVLSTTVT